jgi:hypothetical protein
MGPTRHLHPKTGQARPTTPHSGPARAHDGHTRISISAPSHGHGVIRLDATEAGPPAAQKAGLNEKQKATRDSCVRA